MTQIQKVDVHLKVDQKFYLFQLKIKFEIFLSFLTFMEALKGF